jgi:Putative MetA-pathway of phenol degradation
MNASRPVGSAQPNDVDTLALELGTRTVTAFGTVGVTDRFDLGVAVPVVSVDVEGRRVNTFRGVSSLQALGSAHATGLGDVALRARYAVAGDAQRGLAAGLDVRLPTGREEDLLGAGRASARMFGIGSFEHGAIATHLNAGYTVGGVSREIGYNAAVTYAAMPRVTVVGELIGRRLSNLHRMRDVYAPHATVAGVETMRWLPDGDGVNQLLASSGMKINVGGSYLLTANVLFRLADLGLAARVVPSITLDYTFSR